MAIERYKNIFWASLWNELPSSRHQQHHHHSSSDFLFHPFSSFPFLFKVSPCSLHVCSHITLQKLKAVAHSYWVVFISYFFARRAWRCVCTFSFNSRTQMEDHDLSKFTVTADPQSLENKISAIRLAGPSKLQVLLHLYYYYCYYSA